MGSESHGRTRDRRARISVEDQTGDGEAGADPPNRRFSRLQTAPSHVTDGEHPVVRFTHDHAERPRAMEPCQQVPRQAQHGVALGAPRNLDMDACRAAHGRVRWDVLGPPPLCGLVRQDGWVRGAGPARPRGSERQG